MGICLPLHREYTVYVSPIPQYILGIDVLQGLWLHMTIGEFCLQVQMAKAILWEHADHCPLHLPHPQWVTVVTQYWLPKGHVENTVTIGELEKVVKIRAVHSPFNSPMWPVKKPDCT